jgi:hypothetical protein
MRQMTERRKSIFLALRAESRDNGFGCRVFDSGCGGAVATAYVLEIASIWRY